jgi:hypothetical protein
LLDFEAWAMDGGNVNVIEVDGSRFEVGVELEVEDLTSRRHPKSSSI